MQGKKLFPGQQNIAWRGLGPGAPDRGGGDGALDPAEAVGKAQADKLGLELRPVGVGFRARLSAAVMPKTVGHDVDQRALALATYRIDVRPGNCVRKYYLGYRKQEC